MVSSAGGERFFVGCMMMLFGQPNMPECVLMHFEVPLRGGGCGGVVVVPH